MLKKITIITILAFLAALAAVASECVKNRAEACLVTDAAVSGLNEIGTENVFDEKGIIEIKPERVPLGTSPYVPAPAASGTAVEKNAEAEIDYSNAKDGYIMVRYLGKTDKQLRVIIKCPSGVSYTYSLNSSGKYEVFPLSEGNGSYQASVFKNVMDTKYSTVLSATFQVKLTNEFTPFLRPNQYVNYSGGSETVKKGAELVKNSSGIVAKITSVYSYVTGNITYDKELAKTVQSGYLSDVDAVLRKGKGICFDYAAVMTTMLRSQQVPTKLVIGYSGSAYHAWINVYSTETGWIEKAIYFDGKSWQLMDPTFAAAKTGGNIANTSYSAKFIY